MGGKAVEGAHKKVGRRADKTFAASATTRKASRRKVSGKSAASGTPALRWINMGTNNAAFPEPVITYLTTLAAHKAVNDFDILLGTIQALLRQGTRDLAFTDDTLVSIIRRCNRATFTSSATDFLDMVQYLQLVFKVSMYVLSNVY